jgi:hypothetical protein
MAGKPIFRWRLLAIGQKDNWPATLEIAYDCPVAMIAAPGEVIDADHCKGICRQPSTAANNPEQCVIADRRHRARGKSGRRTPGQSQPEMMNNVLQTSGSSRQRIAGGRSRTVLPLRCASTLPTCLIRSVFHYAERLRLFSASGHPISSRERKAQDGDLLDSTKQPQYSQCCPVG